MQVEVKALLRDRASYDRTVAALSSGFQSQVLQENHFLDTSARELFAQGTVLRVRLFVSGDAKTNAVQDQHAGTNARQYTSAKIMLKEHAHVEDGSQLSWTAEEVVPVDTALQILQAPRHVYALLAAIRSGGDDKILSRLEQEYPKSHLESLEYVGCFTTTRTAFDFPQCTAQTGLKIHVDETVYPFGIRYEVEIPNITVPAHDVAADLDSFLTSCGACFEFAEESKFQRFAKGMEAARASSHMVQDVKVVLESEEDAAKICQNLEASLLSEHLHDNIFFDGFDNELGASGTFLRLRRTDHQTYLLVLKEHQNVDGGSQVNWTQECELPAYVAQELLREPTTFLSRQDVTIAKTLAEKFHLTHLRCIGSFSTLRKTFAWPSSQSQPQGGLKIRVDRTEFPSGTHFEVEVTNVLVPVSDVLSELSAVLNGINVRFHVATESKLDCFLAGFRRP